MKRLKKQPVAMLAVVLAGLGAGRSLGIDDLSLNVDPGSVNVAVGDTVTVTLDVANLSNAINGVQALMHYDAALLQLDLIMPNAAIGGVGWDVAVQNDNMGDITLVVVMNSFGASTMADHAIAMLTFTALANGTTNLAFQVDNPPMVTKLTVASDNTTILPNKFDSGGITIGAAAAPHVAGIEVFYAGRFGDATDPAFSVLGAGSTATINNVTYYVRGITGLRVLFDGVVDFATGNPRDAFSFEWTTTTGTTFTPVAGAAAAISASASVVGGVTVVTLVLTDDLVRRRWLKTTLDATQISMGGVALDGELGGNPVTLPGGDGIPGGNAVFYLGNMTGDVDGDLLITLDDVIAIRLQVNPFIAVTIDNVFDVDKDSLVTLDDVIATRVNVNPFIALALITP